jgi:hypothetical protein
MVQEQVLNNRITMLRGENLIDWYNVTAIPILFAPAVGYLPRQYCHHRAINSSGMNLTWDEVELIIYGTWWKRLARGPYRELWPRYTGSTLFHNFTWYYPLLCRDSRDRVYAILAISRVAEELGLLPDYTALNTVENLSKQLSILFFE